MTTVYFTNNQKKTDRRLFKEVCMYYLCKQLPWMWISKVCTWIKPQVSVYYSYAILYIYVKSSQLSKLL